MTLKDIYDRIDASGPWSAWLTPEFVVITYRVTNDGLKGANDAFEIYPDLSMYSRNRIKSFCGPLKKEEQLFFLKKVGVLPINLEDL